jgi:hypothetical protein
MEREMVDQNRVAGPMEMENGQPNAASGGQMVRLELDDSSVMAAYANFCRVASTPEEVIIDLALNPDPTAAPVQRVKIAQRVVLNHFTAKRLIALLSATVKRHEQVFGPLEIDVRKRVQPEMAAMTR